MAERKTRKAAPTEERSVTVPAVPDAPEADAAVPDAPVTVSPVSDAPETGADLKDTALGGITGQLVVVHADGGLNLRRGPGRDYPVAELLEDDTLLAVLELPYGAEAPGWRLVHTGQRTGWVDRDFIEAVPASGSEEE